MKTFRTLVLSLRFLALVLSLAAFSGGCSDENSGPGANPTPEDQMKQAESAKSAMEANAANSAK